MGVNGVLCSGAGASLVSLVPLLDVRDASCLVTSSEAIVFTNSPGSDMLVNDLNNHITSKKTGILVAPRGVESI